MIGLKTLKPARTLVDQTYDTVLDAICEGVLKPGERLTQEEIAARLEVSRQPVMHALAMLRAQGFVQEAGRRGLVVAPVDPALFDAIYQFRAAVEPMAVRLATRRLTPAAASGLGAVVARGRAAVEAGAQKEVLAADVEFHSAIAELSGNPVVADAMRLNWRHLQRSMGEVLRFPGMTIAVWDEHAAILDAMVAGEGATAGRLMEDHLIGACRRVTGRDIAAGALGGG